MDKLIYTNCDICGNDRTVAVATQKDYKYVECQQCGLVYMNPRPGLELLNSMYATYHQRNGKGADAWDVLMKHNFKQVALMLNKQFPAGGKMLDIGCGYGHFLRIMQKQGWKTEGIDPSPNTVAHALDAGLAVTQTTVDEVSFPNSSFQAVTMFYVLEHLTEPLITLKKILEFLMPGGLLVMRVPHTTPIVRLLSVFGIRNNLYDAPFHLYDFSPSAMTMLIKKAGFESVKIIPGEPTVPYSDIEKVISLSSGYIAKLLYGAGGFLLPGISKTVLAYKAVNTDL